MQLKNLAVFLFSATALAAVEKRDQVDEMIDNAMDSLPTQFQDMPQPDPSVIQVMQTAVPKSIAANPEKAQEAASSLAAGNPPEWFNDLPGDVKDYFNELSDWAKDNADAITSAAGAAPTGGSGDSGDSSDDSGDDSGDDSSSQAPESATSTGGAPAPTGAMAASVAGAFGILGLAIAL